jgi:hypothetical protein
MQRLKSGHYIEIICRYKENFGLKTRKLRKVGKIVKKIDHDYE